MIFLDSNAAEKQTTEACIIKKTNRILNPVLQNSPRREQLRRLPHVFCKFLDLPFPAETNVTTDEGRDAYTFTIQQPGLQRANLVAETEELVPGVIKVILRGADKIRAELNKIRKSAETTNWRARLPMDAMPELAKATYVHGIITITIPKQPAAAKTSRF